MLTNDISLAVFFFFFLNVSGSKAVFLHLSPLLFLCSPDVEPGKQDIKTKCLRTCHQYVQVLPFLLLLKKDEQIDGPRKRK